MENYFISTENKLAKTLQFVSANFHVFSYDFYASLNVGTNHHVTINGIEFVFNFETNYINIWANGFNDYNTIYANETIMQFVNWYTETIIGISEYTIEILGVKLVNIKW